MNIKNGNTGIINPMARTILVLKMNDQGQTELKTELSPKDICKALNNMVTELMFNYCEMLIEHKVKLPGE